MRPLPGAGAFGGVPFASPDTTAPLPFGAGDAFASAAFGLLTGPRSGALPRVALRMSDPETPRRVIGDSVVKSSGANGGDLREVRVTLPKPFDPDAVIHNARDTKLCEVGEQSEGLRPR